MKTTLHNDLQSMLNPFMVNSWKVHTGAYENSPLCIAGQILTEQSQCQEHPSESAFHTSPCLSPVIAHERACEFESEYPFCNVVILPYQIERQTVVSQRSYLSKSSMLRSWICMLILCPFLIIHWFVIKPPWADHSMAVHKDIHSERPSNGECCLFGPIVWGESPGLSALTHCHLGGRLVRVGKRSSPARRRCLHVRAPR